jgi:hypothetical protein
MVSVQDLRSETYFLAAQKYFFKLGWEDSKEGLFDAFRLTVTAAARH